MATKISFCLAALFIFVISFGLIQTRHHSDKEIGEVKEQGMSDAMGALNFWTAARAYPGKDIPPDKYYRAYRESKAAKKFDGRFFSRTSDTAWISIGPLASLYSGNNISSDSRGRTLSVAVNPINSSTIYCGSASGGLWRSHSAGLAGDWQRVILGYPALGISAISIDPLDTNTVYIGTGEVYRYETALGGLETRTTRGSYGLGILKSTDNGATWVKSLDWTYNQERGIQQIRMNPLNHRTLFAATTEGIYRSVDAGGTWTQVLSILMVTDIVINASDTTLVLAACGDFDTNDGGLYRSTDGGMNWTSIPDPVSSYSGKALLETYGANNNIVFASVADSTNGAGSLWKSTNFGGTWSLLQTYPVNSNLIQSQGWYSHFVAVHPTDVNQIVHAGVPISKSTDGGSSFFWSSGYYSDNHAFAHDPNNPDILYSVCDNGIYRSTDFGTNFTNVGSGMLTLQFYNGFSCSASDPNIGLGQVQDHIPGFLYQGTTAWWRPSNSDEVGWTAIDQTNDYNMYTVTRWGQSFEKSTNRGVSFSSMGGFGGTGGFNSPLVVSPSTPNIIYAGSANIYKSTNSGASFTALSGGLPADGTPTLSMAISANDPNIVYVGYVPNVLNGVRLYRTSDAGTNWQNVTGSLPNRYPLDIAINPKNSSTAYATFGGFGSGHLFKTNDLGNSWTNITGSLPDVPTDAVIVDPRDTNIVYVGNDLGVSISTNGGVTWSDFSNGLPEAVIVADLSINRSARLLRVATHGSGVYERGLAIGDIFDYLAFSLQSPPNGTVIAVGSTVPALSATFKNIGAQAPTDSFDVVYKIYKNATQYYSNTKRVASLALGESRQTTFDGSFTPPDSGMYTLEAISLASDQDATDDTVKGYVTVLTPAPITYSNVTKEYCPYAGFNDGTLATSGDDNQTIIALPFQFTFDGHVYDSLQISTNGWLEFGTGARGSQYGISNDGQIGQIGANVNGTLFTPQHPTKALGVWWEDLNVDGPASLSYKTIGSAPHRSFVVQWKNVLAYYDANTTTTRINFQAELDEGSNVIVYHYGPVQAGTLSGSDLGAMMGMKDDLGGDFHFYDIALGGSGTVDQGITTLTPLANWPGPDSCYYINAGKQTVTVAISARWNLISVPVARKDNDVLSMFPTAISGTTYGWNGTAYFRTDTLIPGKGYWTKFSAGVSQQIVGAPLASVDVPVTAGWNLVGSVDHTIPAPSGGMVSGQTYSYSNGYHTATVVQMGRGLWVKFTGSGSYALGPQIMPKDAKDLQFPASITIEDRSGESQTLYFTLGNASLEQYEMPPVPPGGVFDARFASQRIAEPLPQQIGKSEEYKVAVNSADYPLQIRCDQNGKTNLRLIMEEVESGKVISSYVLEPGRAVTVNALKENGFVVKVQMDNELPRSFALRQNYPNPFNPVTTIGFDLPKSVFTTLKIYDINGREIKTLAEGMMAGGRYEMNADFSDKASGVYFYRLQAGSFIALKKLVFIK